jgi:hypothetical protein
MRVSVHALPHDAVEVTGTIVIAETSTVRRTDTRVIAGQLGPAVSVKVALVTVPGGPERTIHLADIRAPDVGAGHPIEDLGDVDQARSIVVDGGVGGHRVHDELAP